MWFIQDPELISSPIATTNLKEWSSSTPTLLSNRALRLGQRRGEGALTTDGWAMMSVTKCIRPFMKAREGRHLAEVYHEIWAYAAIGVETLP